MECRSRGGSPEGGEKKIYKEEEDRSRPQTERVRSIKIEDKKVPEDIISRVAGRYAGTAARQIRAYTLFAP